MMLGDLGADVLKIERPGGGDESRSWGPPFDALGRSAYFLAINRNKLGAALDLDRPGDRESLIALAETADVIVDNFRPGTLERRGVDLGQMLARRDDLVWCTITGFGIQGGRPGYDFVAQAECGWMAITGEAGSDPMKTGVALADVIAGKDAAIAILAALVRRRGSAEDRRIVISLANSARAALVNVAQNVLLSGRDASQWGNAHPNLVPYQLFHATDRAIVIAVGTDAQWRQCAQALDLAELAVDPALATNSGRLAARERIVDAFATAVGRRTAADIQRRLDAVGVPNGQVNSVLDAIRGAGGSPVTGMPSSVGGSVRRAPPLLDEHGDLVRAHGWGAFGLGQNSRETGG